VTVTAVILAAGRGTRFGAGQDKLTATWRGRALIEYPIGAASAARERGVVAEVVVVTRPGAEGIRAVAAEAGCRLVFPDPSQGSGLAASLKAGIRAAGPEARGVVLLLGDQPLVTPEAIAAVIAAAGESRNALVRARYRGNPDSPGHPVFIGRDRLDLVDAATDDAGLRGLVEEHGLVWTELWLEGDNPDVDVAADLTRLR